MSLRLLALFAFAVLPAAHAAPITFSFAGVVDNDPFGVYNDPSNGPATVSGTYFFNATIPMVLSTPNSGGYADVTPDAGMEMTFANTVDPTATGPYVADQLNITVNNNFPGPLDQYLVTGTSSVNPSLTLELILQDFTGTAFSSTALPLTPPSLAAFGSVRFAFATFDGANDLQAGGFLTSLVCTAGCVSTVPEPGTLSLMGSALLLLASMMRRRDVTHVKTTTS